MDGFGIETQPISEAREHHCDQTLGGHAQGEDFHIQYSFVIVSPALVRIIIVLTALLTNALIMAPRRKLAGLVPRNLKAD